VHDQRAHPSLIEKVLVERNGNAVRQIAALLIHPGCIAIDTPEEIVAAGSMSIADERE
jgi:hypothetical protein